MQFIKEVIDLIKHKNRKKRKRKQKQEMAKKVKKQKFVKPTKQLNNKALKIARKNSELLKKESL